MQQNIMAVYEQGILRPLEPLMLPERYKVYIQIVPEPVIDKGDEIVQFLVNMGVITPPSTLSKSSTISKAKRKKLADALAKNSKQTLSEIVIEDRGQW
jgi:predicted DNA-binding antitoxin AbrB/MazE fold protein